MSAEVCLLLVQSLTGDCEATAIAPPTNLTAVAAQPDPVSENHAVAAKAIAPTTASATPQFADFCDSAPGQQAEICTLNSLSRRNLHGSQSVAAPNSAAAAASTRTTAALASPPSVTLPVPVNLPTAHRPVSPPTVPTPQFSPPTTVAANPSVSGRTTSQATLRPTSGSELYRQRQLALQSGQSYTRLAPNAYADQWQTINHQPTYEDWRQLLSQEARATAYGQGQNRLEVVVGDSFGLWLPTEMLPRDRLWLNQSISGDTTAGILHRVSTFANARATTIHLMAGANDLKTGVPEAQIVSNLHRTVRLLKQQHPQAQIVVYSVLPTRRAEIDNARVRSLNARIAHMTQRNSVVYRDIHPQFQDEWGHLHPDLTTDGLHLNPQGYALWQRALLASAW
ncbi:MAG: GDSL-type esterase/lipase family protein [Leptolyngbyaceae cyanobacterium]